MAKLTAAGLAAHYGKDRRTITNWLNMMPPCPSTLEGKRRVFDSVAVAEWREEVVRRGAVADVKAALPDDLEQAKTRKTAAEALIAEIELAEKRRTVVPMAVVEQVGAEMADALRAVLINAPSTYAIDLERAGVPPEAAEGVLDKLSTDLTEALRSAVERVTVEVDDDIGD